MATSGSACLLGDLQAHSTRWPPPAEARGRPCRLVLPQRLARPAAFQQVEDDTLCEIHSDLPVHHALALCLSHERTSASTKAALRARRGIRG